MTRLPVVGLVLAMLALGLWHDNSVYYVLWAMWQSLGILLTHLILRPAEGHVPPRAAWVAGAVSVYLWLSLTKPVVLQLMDLFST